MLQGIPLPFPPYSDPVSRFSLGLDGWMSREAAECKRRCSPLPRGRNHPCHNLGEVFVERPPQPLLNGFRTEAKRNRVLPPSSPVGSTWSPRDTYALLGWAVLASYLLMINLKVSSTFPCGTFCNVWKGRTSKAGPRPATTGCEGPAVPAPDGQKSRQEGSEERHGRRALLPPRTRTSGTGQRCRPARPLSNRRPFRPQSQRPSQ